MISDVEAEDDDGLDGFVVDELAHKTLPCAELVGRNSTKIKASVRLSGRGTAMTAFRVGRESYKVGALLAKHICALTPVGSFARNRLRLEWLNKVHAAHPQRRGGLYSMAVTGSFYLFGFLSQQEHEIQRRMARRQLI